jgi:hypothetical protein
MRTGYAVFAILGFMFLCGCGERRAGPQVSSGTADLAAPREAPSIVRGARSKTAFPDPSAACRRAGGTAKRIKECDGSESLWCDLSPREACYADQVVNGRCTAGKYSEELKGIVGITPRVLCDGGQ